MPRPVSWLPRLHEIRRSVQNSVRSHYDRRDLQQLFELQPRSAQNFFALLPSVPVGRSRLVEREALARFLDGVHEAADVPAYMERVRREGAEVSRKKIRSLVRADLAPASLASLPDSMSLSRGRLEISFRSVEQLAEAMLALARILEAEGEEFAERYEPEVPELQAEDTEEVREMFAELERIERPERSMSATYS